MVLSGSFRYDSGCNTEFEGSRRDFEVAGSADVIALAGSVGNVLTPGEQILNDRRVESVIHGVQDEIAVLIADWITQRIERSNLKTGLEHQVRDAGGHSSRVDDLLSGGIVERNAAFGKQRYAAGLRGIFIHLKIIRHVARIPGIRAIEVRVRERKIVPVPQTPAYVNVTEIIRMQILADETRVIHIAADGDPSFLGHYEGQILHTSGDVDDHG